MNLIDWVWWFSGDYWVIALGDDYDFAVIGEPDREFGWILSRTPSLPRETLERIRERLVASGYDPCVFEMSATPAQSVQPGTTLCDFLASGTGSG